MKKYSNIFNQIILISQFGLSLVVPLVMCLGIAWLLNVKAGWGLWVYFPGFVFGLGSSFMTAYNFYLLQLKKTEKTEKDTKKRVSFNTHE